MLFGPDSRPISSAASPPQPASRGYAYEHPFDAAKRVGYKGYFYFPTLDQSQLMPVQTRDVVNKKAQWLYNNVDAVRVLVDALSLEEVDGGIWPKARTSNGAFNRAVTDDFDNICGDARFFHSDGNDNYFSAQWTIRRNIKLYGECFGQLVRPAPGSSCPLLHFISPWQCSNANTKLDQSRWSDGMYPEKGRPVQYRFLTSDDGKDFQDVPADDVLHFHDPFWIGQRRQMSSLAPIVRKLFSADDIERAEAAGVQLRARMAYALTRASDADGGPAGPTLPGAEIQEVVQEDGSKIQVQVVRSSDGDEVEVMAPPPGNKFEVVESERPLVTIELLKHFYSGFANASLYPAAYVFFLAEMGAGTVPRLIQKRVQRVKNAYRQYQLAPQFCRRWYTFWLWQRIKSGVYDSVAGGVPADWFKHRLVFPADDTIDVGREGKLWDSRLETGKTSPEIYHGLQGEDAEDVEDEIIDGAIRRARKLAEARKAHPDLAPYLATDQVFRPPVNTPPVVTEESPPAE